MSPGGELFTQRKAEQFVQEEEDLILIVGRYEGVDFRVRDMLIDEEISIGEYVLWRRTRRRSCHRCRSATCSRSCGENRVRDHRKFFFKTLSSSGISTIYPPRNVGRDFGSKVCSFREIMRKLNSGK